MQVENDDITVNKMGAPKWLSKMTSLTVDDAKHVEIFMLPQLLYGAKGNCEVVLAQVFSVLTSGQCHQRGVSSGLMQN